MKKFLAVTALTIGAVSMPMEAALADVAPVRPARPAPVPPPPPPPPPVVAPVPPPPPAISPWYFMVSGGAVIWNDPDFSSGSFTGQLNTGTGGYVLAGVGYRFLPWLAAELELGWIQIPISGGTINSTAISLDDATINGFALFGNLVVSIPLGWSGVTPYLGGGIGFVAAGDNSFTATVGGTSVSGTAGGGTNFAMQAKVGVDIRLAPWISIAPEYRFIWVDGGSGSSNTYGNAFGASLKFTF